MLHASQWRRMACVLWVEKETATSEMGCNGLDLRREEESKMQRTTATATYHARILKLRLPEQDSLKDAAEHCSADPASLASIGRAVSQQVRIKRTDGFVAAYTVSEPNPDDHSLADVVRTGLAGRERLGTTDEMEQA